MNRRLFIGIDFGTDSVRALCVDESGNTIAEAVRPYPRWAEGRFSSAAECRFRQHPLDYIESLESVVREVVAQCDASCVAGVGLDTTASTICLTDADGRPLALDAEFAEEPDAMFVLWKDHTALEEARLITETCRGWGGPDFTSFEGGDYSAEWFWSKTLHLLRSNPRVCEAARGVVEHGDWIAALLTGAPLRMGRCTAGHKAMWHASWGGFPPEDFFKQVDPLLLPIRRSLPGETYTADVPTGHLTAEWSRRLGLPESAIVSGAGVDCHVGAVGAGIRPGRLVKVCGTSTCDILVADSVDGCIPGICGQVDGSVIPGMVGLEAGQSSFGDILAWFRNFLGYAGEVSIGELESDAALIPPGTSGVTALDWLNGRRSPFADASLSGAIVGLRLGTTPPMVYRALVEAAVFGSKAIIDHFAGCGIQIDEVVATGGISRKSPFTMQMFADVFGMPISVAECDQTCALGSAIFAATASGAFTDLRSAMRSMASGIDRVYQPDGSRAEAYRKLYVRYRNLGGSIL